MAVETVFLGFWKVRGGRVLMNKLCFEVRQSLVLFFRPLSTRDTGASWYFLKANLQKRYLLRNGSQSPLVRVGILLLATTARTPFCSPLRHMTFLQTSEKVGLFARCVVRNT